MDRSVRIWLPDHWRITYHAEDKDTDRLPRAHLYASAAARFREREPQSGHKDAHLLWGDALWEVEIGRLRH